MGEFTAPLVIREIGYERWEVVESFYWTSRKGLVVHVAAGFTTDLASVPQMLRSIVPKIGYWSQAAVVHDLLYFNHRTGVDDTVSRLQADRALREGAKDKALEYRVPNGKRKEWTIYHAVRGFSLPYWETPQEKLLRLEEDDEYLDQ